MVHELKYAIKKITPYHFQVPMRVLEVTMCTLLAVIATTPLRADVVAGSNPVEGANGNMMDNRRRKQKPFSHWRKWLRCKCCLGNND